MLSSLLVAVWLVAAPPDFPPDALPDAVPAAGEVGPPEIKIQLTYKFGQFNWPGRTLAQWKAAAKKASDEWAKRADIRFLEVPNAKPRMYTFDITTRSLPGKAGLWQPGHLIVSTYPPQVAAWRRLSPYLQEHYMWYLIWEEEFHALGGPQSVHLRGPNAMIAWVQQRWPLPPGNAAAAPGAIEENEAMRLVREPVGEEASRGYWETRTVPCGAFGQQRANGRFTREVRVWVEGEPPEEPTAAASGGAGRSGSSASGNNTQAAKPATPGVVCPGGVCRQGGS
jgi:hypothetical protein